MRRHSKSLFFVRLALISILLQAPALWAGQSGHEGPEDFRIELTGAAWLRDSVGTVNDRGTSINLLTDLGAEQRNPTFFGRLVWKPGRKHRLIAEGTPVGISGLRTIQRNVVYLGRDFTVSETLQSSASLNYAFLGYQYDFLTGRSGHLGFSAGAAYLGLAGSINALDSGTHVTRSTTLGLPLAGLEFRLFPIPRHKLFEVEGGMRGIGAGAYGEWVEANASGGFRLGPVALLAGYRELLIDFHSTRSNPSGVDVRLKGPIFSALWSW